MALITGVATTVKELVALLRKFSPDAEVFIEDWDHEKLVHVRVVEQEDTHECVLEQE